MILKNAIIQDELRKEFAECDVDSTGLIMKGKIFFIKN